ncbi:MAG: hypothetical protein LBB38_02650 [Puniceicoccales bacterium]|jgi:hypothetical protein|nr:hypothetical protein [Puniceicoccales bacterium]
MCDRTSPATGSHGLHKFCEFLGSSAITDFTVLWLAKAKNIKISRSQVLMLLPKAVQFGETRAGLAIKILLYVVTAAILLFYKLLLGVRLLTPSCRESYGSLVFDGLMAPGSTAEWEFIHQKTDAKAPGDSANQSGEHTGTGVTPRTPASPPPIPQLTPAQVQQLNALGISPASMVASQLYIDSNRDVDRYLRLEKLSREIKNALASAKPELVAFRDGYANNSSFLGMQCKYAVDSLLKYLDVLNVEFSILNLILGENESADQFISRMERFKSETSPSGKLSTLLEIQASFATDVFAHETRTFISGIIRLWFERNEKFLCRAMVTAEAADVDSAWKCLNHLAEIMFAIESIECASGSCDKIYHCCDQIFRLTEAIESADKIIWKDGDWLAAANTCGAIANAARAVTAKLGSVTRNIKRDFYQQARVIRSRDGKELQKIFALLVYVDDTIVRIAESKNDAWHEAWNDKSSTVIRDLVDRGILLPGNQGGGSVISGGYADDFIRNLDGGVFDAIFSPAEKERALQLGAIKRLLNHFKKTILSGQPGRDGVPDYNWIRERVDALIACDSCDDAKAHSDEIVGSLRPWLPAKGAQSDQSGGMK